MKYLLFTSLVCGLFFSNCHTPFPKKEEKEKIKTLSYDTTNVQLLSTNIDIKNLEDWHYGIEEVAGKPYIYFLNYNTHELNFLDIKNNKSELITKVALPIDFHIRDFEILDEEKYISILGYRDDEFDGDMKIYVFNFDGDLIYIKKIPQSDKKYMDSNRHIFEYEMVDLYTFYFMYYVFIEEDKQDFSAPIEAKWDAKNDIIEPLAIYYPEIYKTHYFGLSTIPSKTKINDSLYAYGFGCYDSIYIYNRNTQNIEKKLMNSKEDYQFRNIPYSQDMAKYNERAKDELYNYNSFYMSINYMPNTKTYSRVFFLHNDVNNKKVYKVVYYNDKFEYLGETDRTFEIEIDNELYNFHLQRQALDRADTSKEFMTLKFYKLHLNAQ